MIIPMGVLMVSDGGILMGVIMIVTADDSAGYCSDGFCRVLF